MKNKSLSFKLTLFLILGVSLVYISSNFIMYNLNKNSNLEEFNKKNLKTVNHLLGSLALPIWDVNEEQAPRKYYYLTGAGNATLKEMNNSWTTQNKAIINLISSNL